jgi:hypothetical protein
VSGRAHCCARQRAAHSAGCPSHQHLTACAAPHYQHQPAPSPQVRRWFFFHSTTLAILEALDNLTAAAGAALAAPERQRRLWWRRSKQQQQHARAGDVELGQQQQQQPMAANATAAGASAAPAPSDAQPSPPAVQPQAAAGSAAGGSSVAARARASFMRHTAWMHSWLPLALNTIQFENLRVVLTRDVPAAFGSKQGGGGGAWGCSLQCVWQPGRHHPWGAPALLPLLLLTTPLVLLLLWLCRRRRVCAGPQEPPRAGWCQVLDCADADARGHAAAAILCAPVCTLWPKLWLQRRRHWHVRPGGGHGVQGE